MGSHVRPPATVALPFYARYSGTHILGAEHEARRMKHQQDLFSSSLPYDLSGVAFHEIVHAFALKLS
jgi:hypothetical protein